MQFADLPIIHGYRLIFVPESVPHIQDETKFARHNSEAQQAVTQLASGFTPTELTKLALEKQKRAKQFAKQQQQVNIFCFENAHI